MDKIQHFYLKRLEDETGISGTGIVAVGAEFPSGHCVLEWLTFTSSIGVYKNIKDLEAIHSHGGKTLIIYGDIPHGDVKIEWRDVTNYVGKYQVSSIGQVRSNFGKIKYLKPDINEDGYHIYTLSKKKYSIHRLVLETFKGASPEGKDICRHLDGNPSNNFIKNLDWGTRSENELDKVAHGTHNRGERSGKTFLTNEQVLKLRNDFENRSVTVAVFLKEKSAEIGMSESGIRKIVKGESFKYLKKENKDE